MRVVESGQNRVALQIHLLCAGSCQRQNLAVGSHGHKTPVGNSHCLSNGEVLVHGHNLPVVKHKVRRKRIRHSGRTVAQDKEKKDRQQVR